MRAASSAELHRSPARRTRSAVPSPRGKAPVRPCPTSPVGRQAPNHFGRRPRRSSPRSGMTGVRPIGVDSATVGPDDRTVAIRFWSGIEPCAVLDHVALAYGSDSVTVTLFEGSDPSAGMVACPDIAMLKQVTVSLDQDLAGRAIVDGAK